MDEYDIAGFLILVMLKSWRSSYLVLVFGETTFATWVAQLLEVLSIVLGPQVNLFLWVLGASNEKIYTEVVWFQILLVNGKNIISNKCFLGFGSLFFKVRLHLSGWGCWVTFEKVSGILDHYQGQMSDMNLGEDPTTFSFL